MAPPTNLPGWPEYYHFVTTQEGEEKRLVEEGLSSMDLVNSTMIGKEVALLNAVTHRPMFSFLLIPCTARSVYILHCCARFAEAGDGQLFGILGTKCSAPKKLVNVKSLVRGIQIPTMMRGNTVKTSSLRKIMEVTSAEEFSALTGDDDGEDLSFLEENFPASVFLPSQLFVSAVSGPTMRADDLTSKIVLAAANGYDDNEADDKTTGHAGTIEAIPEPLPTPSTPSYSSGQLLSITLRDASLPSKIDDEFDELVDGARQAMVQRDPPPRPPENNKRPGRQAGDRDDGCGRGDDGDRRRHDDRRAG
jgi:hypothetical protein